MKGTNGYNTDQPRNVSARAALVLEAVELQQFGEIFVNSFYNPHAVLKIGSEDDKKQHLI